MWDRRSRSASSARRVETAGANASARALGIRAARLPAVPNGTRVRLYAVARSTEASLASPVMGRPCIAYRLVVERPGRQQVLERTACAPFLAQDGDVTISVEGPFAVVLDSAYEWEFGTDVQRRLWHLLDADEVARRRAGGSTLRRLLRTWLAPDPGWPGEPAMRDGVHRQDYRYFEALIQPGDRISIEGFASMTVDPAGERAGLREPPLLYTIAGTPERPAIISVPEPGSMAP